MDNSEEVRLLIAKYLAGNASEEEKILVERFYLEQYNNQPLPENLADADDIKSEIWKAVEERIQGRPKPVTRLWPRIAAAASILLVLSAGGYFLLHKKPMPQMAQEIKPGGNKAILTLSNGKQIILTDARNGLIAQQKTISVQKTADGKIVYQANQAPSPSEKAGDEVFNTLHTPRGGRYEGTLTDGTHFILDAASSIKYPVQFNKKERIVEVTGQAFFEVKHDPAHPFKVIAKEQTIEDIGTQFNINAYDDEPALRNTLVEGSIKVSKQQQSVILKPGQQSVIANATLTVANADISEAIAWKNGQTTFKDEDLRTIMRQVSRWYDINVKYEGQIPTREFAGGISRSANFKDFLKILSFYNVHYTVAGKTITITP